MSLVTSLGINYCNDWVRNCMVVYEGDAYYIESFHSRDNPIVVLRNIVTREVVEVGHEWMTGFSVLAYPELGYRKSQGTARHYGRRQTAYRGLRQQVLVAERTPATVLYEQANGRYGSATESVDSASMWLRQVMIPEYDGPEVLDEVLSGNQLCYVPNNHICIEPLPNSPNHGVYYKEKLVGTIDRERTLDIAAPNIRKAVEEVL